MTSPLNIRGLQSNLMALIMTHAISEIRISNQTFLLISIPKCLIHPSFWRSPTGILNSILKLSHSLLSTTLPPLTHLHYLSLLPQKTESAPAGFSSFSKRYHSLPSDVNPRKRLLYSLSQSLSSITSILLSPAFLFILTTLISGPDYLGP